MVLGLFDPEFDTEPWEEKEFTLKPGEKILLYTDGVTEARSPDGEEYGYERLVELLKANGSLPSDELAHKIAEEAARFHEKDSFEDDLTVLVIERPQD